MPGVQVARGGRSRSAGGIHGGLSTEMVDYGVVPVFAVLMAQDDVVSGHGRIWVLFLEKVAFLGAFAESSFGEVDMVDISTRSGCRCVLREAKRRAKKSEKQCASAFQKYPPTLNFLDLGAGQLECERSQMKRANHNTEGKFCQNLGEPTHAVSHCQAIFLSFLADFPISSTGPRIHSEYGCHGARDLTFTSSPARLGTTALNRSRICIRDFLECPQKCLCLPAQRAVPRMNHVEAAS